MTIRAVLFDLGGTLLHYWDPHHGDPQRPFRRLTLLGFREVVIRAADGSPVPSFETMTEILDQHIGASFRALAGELRGGSVETPVRAALAELGYPLDDGQWAALRPVYYAALEPLVSPRKGVRETLEALHSSGTKMGIISNTWWAADFHDSHLAHYEILDLLPVRIYSCEQEHVKPHPAIFENALQQIGVEAGQAVYVGDRPDIDVRGAQGAGMRAVLIHTPYQDAPLDEVVPDAVIDELPELPAALEKLA